MIDHVSPMLLSAFICMTYKLKMGCYPEHHCALVKENIEIKILKI